jgi:serine protease inhibitor
VTVVWTSHTIVQKTYIRVDEEGTEAAAVTGGVMAKSAGPPPRS